VFLALIRTRVAEATSGFLCSDPRPSADTQRSRAENTTEIHPTSSSKPKLKLCITTNSGRYSAAGRRSGPRPPPPEEANEAEDADEEEAIVRSSSVLRGCGRK